MIKRRRETNAVPDKVKDSNVSFYCRVTIFISTALHIAAESNLKDPHCNLLTKLPSQNLQHANKTKHPLHTPLNSKISGLIDGSETAKYRLEYFSTTEQAAATQKHGPICDHHFHPSREKKPEALKESHQQEGKRNRVHEKEGERERKVEGSLFIVLGADFHQRLKYW